MEEYEVMPKIIEKILEPSEIYTNNRFKLKIKVIRYLTYQEVKTKKYIDIKKITYENIKGG